MWKHGSEIVLHTVRFNMKVTVAMLFVAMVKYAHNLLGHAHESILMKFDIARRMPQEGHDMTNSQLLIALCYSCSPSVKTKLNT